MAANNINAVYAMEILDSRGNPTTAARVVLENGISGTASVPSGASTGKYEAIELRDSDTRYGGKGVLNAVGHINTTISNALRGLDVTDQEKIDFSMIDLDGTPTKSRLGANAILAVSLAVARAAASTSGLSLYRYLGGDHAATMPVPMMNILNGGVHASNNLDVQEYMIVPVGAENFTEALRWCAEIYWQLKKLLLSKGLSVSVGDEGGFAPNLSGDEEALDFIVKAAELAGYRMGTDIRIALDAAASEWYQNGKYLLPKKNLHYHSSELVSYWQKLITTYPIISLEDGVAEDDWDGWVNLTQQLGEKVQLVGDDLFVTNTRRLEKGIALGAANAILIKPNQVGTLTETIEAVKTAQKAGYHAIISHRSGETEDTFIADLAVSLCCGQIKTGAPARSERTAKYNRLLMIEHELGKAARYPGSDAF